MILGDAGPFVANLIRRDQHHAAVVRFLQTLREPVFVPSVVLAEISHFLNRDRLIAEEAQFLRALAGGGSVAVIDPVSADYARAADLVERYADFPLGTVDALIAAMAERLGVTTILTLDRRHFGAIRPRHCERFTLVP